MAEWESEWERGDGVTIQKLADHHWVVRNGDDHMVEACPCCDRPLLTAQAARFVADEVFPPEEQPPPMAA